MKAIWSKVKVTVKAIWNKVKENTLLSILSVLLTLTFVAFVCVLFSERAGTHISELPGLSKKNLETLKFVGIGMGGLLVALQALMSYKRAKALEDTAKTQADAAKAQARATEEQAKANKLTEQGQRQDRLKNAIEHLGHESDSVRLGGAYELFHLAKDTLEEDPKEKLSQTVLDILCAHIRRITGEDGYREKHELKPSEEVQSLLTLLFVQEYEVFRGCHINLQGSWLNGADLKEARLWKARLTQVYLQRANLERAHLQRANLVDAHLEAAFLHKAQLQDTVLLFAHLQGARLDDIHLQGATLNGAKLQRAVLSRAKLQGARLNDTYLQGATLNGAKLQGAMLNMVVHLQGATLNGALLQGIGNMDEDSMSFEEQIRWYIDKTSDLSGIVFAGGLSQEDVDFLVEGLPDYLAIPLRRRLRPHIGEPESHELPQNSGAERGAYTKEEAEKWIAEYKKAMSEIPEDDS